MRKNVKKEEPKGSMKKKKIITYIPKVNRKKMTITQYMIGVYKHLNKQSSMKCLMKNLADL